MEISAKPQPVTERRAAPRFPCNLETVCRLVATVPDVPWPAKVRNISLGGMCLVLSERVLPGTVIEVELHDVGTEPHARTVQMRVTSAAEYPSGGWICGGAFTNRLNPDELRALLR